MNYASALPREPLFGEPPFRKAPALCFRTVAAWRIGRALGSEACEHRSIV